MSTKTVKVCLDAGHYGSKYNQSTEVPAYYESEMAWKLHLYLKEEMEAYGFEVITTRANQADDLELYTRGAMSKGCDLFISLHSNACGTESVDYPVVFRAYDNWNNAEAVALPLSVAIGELMGTAQAGKTGTREGTSGTEYYGVMRGARAGGCPLYLLIEHSFHTNEKASYWLLEEENLKKLAQLEADFFAEYYGVTEDTPEDTSTYTKIMGEAQVSAGQMVNYLLSVNPNATGYQSLPQIFLDQGKLEGVRGDIAFAQACLETGNFAFGGDVLPEQNNFCGLGATGNGVAGCSFATMAEGAIAQIQHLQAYASENPLVGTCVDPRYHYVTRNSAQYVEWLGIQENPNGIGWASGANYGEKILEILGKMKGMEEMEQEEIIPDLMKTAVEWMTAQELMKGDDTGKLRVEDPVTRGEFSVMLYAYHQKMIEQ